MEKNRREYEKQMADIRKNHEEKDTVNAMAMLKAKKKERIEQMAIMQKKLE